MYHLFWMISAIISFAGARLWVKVLVKTDPTWKAKEHRWGLYIFAGVLSIFVALVFYLILTLIWQPLLFSHYEAADDFWYSILVNGPAEEWAKFFVFWFLASALGKVKEPRDGVLVAMMVALGFSFWENIRYILTFGPSSIANRVLWASSGHMAYAAIWGYFGGQVILEPPEGKGILKYRYVIAAVFSISFIHGLFNFLVSWVGSGAAFVIDLLIYVATLIILTEVLRLPSAYRQFTVKDTAIAIPAITEALKGDPKNITLKRRLGFYHLAD
jgi:RsiW-degrading membrane proteinase PrsW (M82 family)